MKKVIFSMLLAMAILLARNASAELACYEWRDVKIGPGLNSDEVETCIDIEFKERYKLNIQFHSRLSEHKEVRKFGHPNQFVYSVNGKHVGTCGEGTTRPVVGTIHVALPIAPGNALMGLESFNSSGCPNFCKDVEVSCKSTGPGWPPESWSCSGQNKFGIEFTFDLVKVKETVDPLCCKFDDPEASGQGPASGLTRCLIQCPDDLSMTEDQTPSVTLKCADACGGQELTITAESNNACIRIVEITSAPCDKIFELECNTTGVCDAVITYTLKDADGKILHTCKQNVHCEETP